MRVLTFLILLPFLSLSCKGADNNGQPTNPKPVEEIKYDTTGILFKSYKGLVMAGYQGCLWGGF